MFKMIYFNMYSVYFTGLYIESFDIKTDDMVLYRSISTQYIDDIDLSIHHYLQELGL